MPYIRHANQDDFPRLIELSAQFSTSPFSFDSRFRALSESQTPIFATEMITAGFSTSLVALEDERIVGFVTVSQNQSLSRVLSKNIGNILLLVVEKEYRDRDIAKILVQKAVKLLFAMGVELLTVGTDIYNIPAVSVYESIGFRFRMGWHIFRKYRESTYVLPLNERVDLVRFDALDSFTPYFDRPISLLYERSVDSDALKTYLVEHLIDNIKKGSTTALNYTVDNNIVGFINYAKDEISQKTLGIDKKLYKIADLLVLPEYRERGIEGEMLADLEARLFDAAVLEMWVSATNERLIHLLEASGFTLSYTGVSFHLLKT